MHIVGKQKGHAVCFSGHGFFFVPLDQFRHCSDCENKDIEKCKSCGCKKDNWFLKKDLGT